MKKQVILKENPDVLADMLYEKAQELEYEMLFGASRNKQLKARNKYLKTVNVLDQIRGQILEELGSTD